jgi:ATP-grasp domain
VLDREPAGGWLSRTDAEALLATHGVRVAGSYLCRDLERLLAVAREIGGPVVLKADFASPAQASEIDAVLLGLDGESAVQSAWHELERRVETAGREWSGAIAQPLVAPGADLLVGAFRDPDLGAVITLALGGRHAGLGEEIACRRPPATDVEADELIDSSQGVAAVLDGFGGRTQLDRGALRDLILRLALMLEEIPEVVEADLNPVRCTTDSSLVLDARVCVERPRPVERVKTW